MQTRTLSGIKRLAVGTLATLTVAGSALALPAPPAAALIHGSETVTLWSKYALASARPELTAACQQDAQAYAQAQSHSSALYVKRYSVAQVTLQSEPTWMIIIRKFRCQAVFNVAFN
jgi:hypothetical protein